MSLSLKCVMGSLGAGVRSKDIPQWLTDSDELTLRMTRLHLERQLAIGMPKRDKSRAAKSQNQPVSLKGWHQIAAFLGEPVSVVQRWASEGMPLTREGRFVITTAEQLNTWLGRESGKPVHVATEGADLSAELKRGLSFVRREKQAGSAKTKAGASKTGKAEVSRRIRTL